ncbi:hypothetical protein L484_010049 [Morus notabilis]|uniref:Dienelactone hydrolase domain-containing protein n=1 Tax=Morus notabilis TaxID=981085 RepID=W9RL70_9ROSA|nr:endo-1,3;1,4-beta-D-glucanase [Morus notabilis]EXB95850.1 hypothetical protein L484_010049 [Morus notabilis]
MSGPQCCSNPPTLNPSSGAGNVNKLGGINSYVTGASNSRLAVLLISDVYGYEAPNLRKLADKIAEAGFFVAIPDFLHGDPFVPGDASRPISVWIKDHGTDKGCEEAKPVIEDLKSKGFSAIGAAGLCWGAKVVVELAKLDNLIQAAALLHPSFVTVDDIKEVNVSIAILGAEHDNLSPPPLVKQFEEVLKAKSEIDSFVKIYPGVSHGWTVRYDVHDEAASKRADEAHKDLLAWFIKHVK